VQDPLMSNLMSELIRNQSEKNVLLENKQEKSPYLKQLDIKIENLKKTIVANIGSILKTTDITIEELSRRIGSIKNEITKLPKTERELLGIERKFNLNNEIYTYLLEKRAEANIMKASNMPDHELIEPARPVGNIPVSPNKPMNYIFALILGLVIPFSYLRIRKALSNKIEREENISRITDFSIIGKILHNNKRISNVVLQFPNSIISESFRTLRTNLEFYLRGTQNRIVLITSSIEGEGKSFVALNMAMSYAMLNSKTVLLSFDLRKGDNYSNFKEGDIGGLTSYLINKADLNDIIVRTEHEMLDYIPSGPIPPNPIELIGLGKTEMLFNELKNKYDYIIVDTSPIGMVSDAYTLMKYADVKLVVVRYNRTRKNVFSSVIKDLNQKQVDNVCVLLNDNKVYKEQYGYGYYTSEAKKRKKWAFGIK
jgi:capsular exopolysaccharide family